MSTAIIVHIRAADAEAARARLARTSLAAGLADVSASFVRRPNFHTELYGFAPTVTLYFALYNDMLWEARAAIAPIVRSYLVSSDDDMVAVYIDTIIVKRVGDVRLCHEDFRAYVPADQPWSIVPWIDEAAP